MTPDALAAFADPPPEALAPAEATFGFLLTMRGVEDADAAAEVLRDMAGRLA